MPAARLIPVSLALAALLSCASLAREDSAPARASSFMVASSEARATRIGEDVLRSGGNAIDAAIAVALALCVTHPAAGNIGGGGFLLVHTADGRDVFIDYRETAPAAASADMYLRPDGSVDTQASLAGWRASGVPGTIAGLAMARDMLGTKPWADLVEPARRLALEGFDVSEALSADLRKHEKRLRISEEATRIYLRAGAFWSAGDRFTNPDLAATLGRLKERGPREFYEGITAQRIVQEMRAGSGGGGLITLDDLKAYTPIVREPLRAMYRGLQIITAPPPSSGGVALITMLRMLEPHDLRALGAGTPATLHLMLESMKRAFADRAAFLGDPGFVDVPVAMLTSPEHAAALASTIDPHRATPSANIIPEGAEGLLAPSADKPDTTHFVIVDALGNAVSNTYTLNEAYGSGVVVRTCGFLLNNEMDDFAAKPGVPNAYRLVQSAKNAIAPGKRPLSSMTPTIVLKDSRPFLVAGSPGGPTIISVVLQTILNVVDFDMDVAGAVAAPRFHHQWLPDEVRFEPDRLTPQTRAALEALGHKFQTKPEAIGDAQAILISVERAPDGAPRRVLFGASDPRGKTGLAEGD